MITLEDYGWTSLHQDIDDQTQNEKHPVGRVVSVQGFKYILVTSKGELETELAGKLIYSADPEDLPKVGDWVYYLDFNDTGYVVGVLPRINALTRRNPGKRIEKQVLGTNIDYALIVQGLDSNFNVMRLERYIAQVLACNITPIVILNKSDLVPDVEPYRAEMLKLKRDCKVVFCSALTGAGSETLHALFEKKKTYILVGSSGVGKSSLLNVLMNEDRQKTGSVSDANSKGKHTTSTRDLFKLSNGSLLIDSPGMREFGFTLEDGQDVESLFPGLGEFAASCRYADCLHRNEPGCAVLEALQSGSLSPEIYESYVKMMKEQKRFDIRIEDKKRLGKQFGKIVKEAKSYRKKYKY